MRLNQNFVGLPFAHPIVVASGKWVWTAEQCKQAMKAGAAAVTTKSFWGHEHRGNPEPTVLQTRHWTLNAVGLPDLGPAHSQGELQQLLPNPEVPLIVSILGLTREEYAGNAARIAPLKPSAFEVNLSSPTFLKLKGAFFDADEAVSIIPAVKEAAGGIPIFAKLSPNMHDIGGFAARCVEAGVDGITAINTLGTGLAINLQTRVPVLSAKKGGISGRGLKPLAVRCVADIFEATKGAVPIIGVGGIFTGEDAIEMMIAGASIVGLASAIIESGFDSIRRIKLEMESWCAENGVDDIYDIVGTLRR